MKFKSKSLISIILSIMMVISMILVAIPANAAVINSVPVGAGASNGIIPAGESIYYDFTANGSGQVNYCGGGNTGWAWNDEYYNTSTGIIEVKLTSDMNFNVNASGRNNILCQTKNGGWTPLLTTVPGNGQNMVVVAADGKSYKWDTYGGSTTNKYTVTYGSNNDSLGTVLATTSSGSLSSGSPQVDKDTEVTFTATPTGSNEFKGWFSDSTCNTAIEGATSTTYKTTITKNTTVYAKFEAPTSSDKITVYFKNTAGWTTVKCYAWYNDGTNDTKTTENWPGNTMTLIDSTNKVYSIELSSNSTMCVFNPGGDDGKTTDLTIEAGKIYVYDSSNTSKTTWDDYGSTPSGQYKLADKSGNYGKVEFKVGGNTVTRANAGDEVTATVIPNPGFIYVAKSFSVTNDTSKEAVGTPDGTTLTFTMPASNVTATAKFELNKAEYVKTLKDGLYVDVAPGKNDTTATFVKWNNYTGVGQDAPSSGYAEHNTKDYHTLYIPANVDLSSVTLYNAFSYVVKINGQTVPADGTATVSLTETTYEVNDDNTFKVQVLKGSTSSMFLYTNDGNGNDYNLPTSKKNYTGLLDKETVKASGGLCTTIKGSTVSDALDLSQVKGRGNSSWEASALLFGKYAFNMKLSSATSLFDLPKSKSFCLLANNMDDAMMRNAYIYQLAKDIGLYDSPEFEFVDIYDNGEYMGAYLVTEKVDVGDKNKLIKGNSIDDLNEKVGGAKFDEDNRYKSDTIGYAKATNSVDLDNNAEFKNTYQTTGTYLLEFEIPDRVQNEVSYFKSSKGQNVVLKNPEFATKGEVEFIRGKFNEMEALVYADTIDLEALSKVMDLDSFARMYLIQEFTSNLDSAATSYYITYDCSKGLFVASPVWDYDMALGQNKGSKYDKNGNNLWADKATAWFAKEKAMGDGTQHGSYSLQSKLATDSNFQTVIKKVWNGKNNDGFYNKVQAYYQDGGYLDIWKNQISKSISMNEERWGFIANNPARSNWGSPNTTNFNGKTGFEGAVEFLKGTNNAGWSKNRVDNLLNGGINAYGTYTQIATPTLTAYDSDGKTALTGTVTAGDTYVLKATTSEIYVDYVLYDGSKVVDTNTNGVFTIDNATVGTHSYTVKTVYKSAASNASSPVEVTVSEALEISRVTISSKTQVNVNEKFTLTATASPNGLTGVTYTFYKDGEAIPEATDIEYNTFTTTITSAGTAEYKVKATLNGKIVESDPVTVTAKTASVNQDVTIYFKTATAPAYAPYVSFDDGNATAMTKSSELGKDYSGALTFAWYSVTINDVDTTKTHTLTFTSKRTKLNATWSGTLTSTNSYFTADNLMRDTVAVNLTGESEVKRNFFYSATNMVFDISDEKNKTLGFTYYGGARVKMGSVVNDLNGTVSVLSEPNVKSATYIQMLNASLITVSSLQSELYDVNFDGKVDVKDATYIQYALAN